MSQELQVAPADITKYQKELQFLLRQTSTTETAQLSRSSDLTLRNNGDGRLATARKLASNFTSLDYPKSVNLELDDSDLAAFGKDDTTGALNIIENNFVCFSGSAPAYSGHKECAKVRSTSYW